MKEFILIVVSVTTFLAIFEGVLPRGKSGRLVKTVMSLIVVLTMLVPIVKIFNEDYDFNSLLNGNEAYENYLEEYKITTLKKEIKAVLKSENIETLEVFVELDENQNKLKILLNMGALNESDGHIDILEKAKRLVIERLYLNDWEVLVG